MHLNMTPRNEKVLIRLFYNRYMDSEQIATLFFKYKEKDGTLNSQYKEIARRNMQKMVEKPLQFVKEFTPYVNTKKIYGLSDRGVGFVCSLLGLKYTEHQNKGVADYLNIGFLNHSIAITDFYLSLIEYAKQHKGIIKSFLVERHNRRTFIHNGQKHTFQPDIFLIYNNKAFYIELDRGTEAPKMYAKKIPVYEAFYSKEILQEDWQPKTPVYPTVITLCDTQERIKKLQTNTKLKWLYVLKNDWSWLH